MKVAIHLSEHKSSFAVKIFSVPRFILGCCYFYPWAPNRNILKRGDDDANEVDVNMKS